jgi:hypothetical protein
MRIILFIKGIFVLYSIFFSLFYLNLSENNFKWMKNIIIGLYLFYEKMVFMTSNIFLNI